MKIFMKCCSARMPGSIQVYFKRPDFEGAVYFDHPDFRYMILISNNEILGHGVAKKQHVFTGFDIFKDIVPFAIRGRV